MMADERDYLERWQSLAEKHTGERQSEDDLVKTFILHSHAKRVGMLEAWDAEPRRAIANEETEMRRAAERAAFRERLGVVHEALRRAGR